MSTGTNLFGQQPQPSTSGLFGSTNAFNQNKSFGFGSTPGQSGLFGQQPQQQAGSSLFQPNSSMLFGNNSFGNQTTGTVIKFNPPTGTDTMQKNGVTQSISTKHHSISCMKEYENKSYEELRFEDYSANRKGPQQTGFGSTPFGAPPTTTPSIFGQTDNKPVFGQPQAFGQTSAFGQTTPAFGATNPTSTPNLFGKPNTFGTTSTTPGFGFNPTPATNPFSSNQTQKPFSQPLFGTATTQAQSTFGTGVFGQTNTQVSEFILFQTWCYEKSFRIQPLTYSKNRHNPLLDLIQASRVFPLISLVLHKVRTYFKFQSLILALAYLDKPVLEQQDLDKQVNLHLDLILGNSQQVLLLNLHKHLSVLI